MESEEVFLGFHKTSRTDAETLFNLVKSSFMSFGLSLSGVHGQGYDGAANMAGRHNGLQAKFLAEISCFGHQLNLVVQVNPRGSSGVGENERSGPLHKELSKKLDKFKDMVAQVGVGEIALNNQPQFTSLVSHTLGHASTSS
ncbi:Zinc finger MYM-type protein 1 [Oopsacas minuta]|uniref:Zinc finger MYM-type protein 1 n=1 Tax=Oopsacas minuta TaxID=111878 RepID=A0AAV7K460_9METZ|nr:Zinc finger MYM-type protein 1 [Oopsacas minuta]